MTAATAAAAPTRQDAMRALLQGVAADLVAYRGLLALLERQFQGAVRHQSALLGELAATMLAEVEAMEGRRRQRVSLVQQLLGPAGTMMQAFALLKSAARERMEADWIALEQLVLECKRLGKRNSDLLVDQYTIMQRVLHGEEQLYEPA
ncbi:flagellar protein FlgN [Rugamonas sp.]|uniref:flagellar protein FlgN n=1 Tax=Rugamonas sp. TaxID=1926287 RepID=UPI0025E9BE20|nr:flagellar protein FlgN [Rugamonas sp.]